VQEDIAKSVGDVLAAIEVARRQAERALAAPAFATAFRNEVLAMSDAVRDLAAVAQRLHEQAYLGSDQQRLL
jgi:hypothetical protein